MLIQLVSPPVSAGTLHLEVDLRQISSWTRVVVGLDHISTVVCRVLCVKVVVLVVISP
jgi:hypothetical protein